MGGNEITAMARLHPERVDRIVYLDGAYDWADPLFVAAYKAVPPIYLNPPASVMASLDALRTYQTNVSWPGVDASRLEACRRELVVVQRDQTLRPVMSDAVMRTVTRTLFTDRRDYIGVECPVLAIYSESNLDLHPVDAAQAAANLAWEKKYMAPFRAASIERVRRELPNAKVMTVAGTHVSFVFTPAVMSAIRRFLTP